jgi:hypothetical protein
MSQRALELGIKAIQAGSTTEGARLLRYALKRDDQRRLFDGDQRATAHFWLAETTPDPALKRAHYAHAAATARDPNLANEARARMNALTAAAPPPVLASVPTPPPGYAPQTAPTALPIAPAAPYAPNANIALCVARIVDGANGVGTAIYVDGLWATTRRVVGGLERVTVELHGLGQRTAVVVKSAPELDIALLHIDHTPPAAPTPIDLTLNVEVPLTALSFDGQVTRGTVRPTNRAMPEQWIPTDFTTLPDAGGDPLFDPSNQFVGIMTRNTARSADHYFGVTVRAIRALVAATLRELASDPRTYCPSCGSSSRALTAGYFYCEVCGAVGSAAAGIARTPLNGIETVYAVGGAPCATCGAAAGAYQGKCLRCGGAA